MSRGKTYYWTRTSRFDSVTSAAAVKERILQISSGIEGFQQAQTNEMCSELMLIMLPKSMQEQIPASLISVMCSLLAVLCSYW